jgi:hypothetical protein
LSQLAPTARGTHLAPLSEALRVLDLVPAIEADRPGLRGLSFFAFQPRVSDAEALRSAGLGRGAPLPVDSGLDRAAAFGAARPGGVTTSHSASSSAPAGVATDQRARLTAGERRQWGSRTPCRAWFPCRTLYQFLGH